MVLRIMSDPGLEQAVRAAGGITELARRIGISQPSVSNWERVPAGRVVAVEVATGVPREVLRPDLYNAAPVIDDIEAARAREYGLLAILLRKAPDAALLQRLAQLRGDATPLGLAHAALAEAATAQGTDAIAREYFTLFIGIGRGELLPYASYYLTGFLHERPLARVRADLARLGLERADGQNDPEDHAAILCEIMSGLIAGNFAAPAAAQHQFFEEHLAPWLGQFFLDLEGAKGADFYRAVGTVGRLFIAIETEAFALPA
jgi:TorA maturation chaperone TorD